MEIIKLFPGFRTKALTFSFDDGVIQDREVVKIFQKYHLKATFNINSGLFEAVWELRYGEDNIQQHIRMTREETATLYQGFEVAGHSLTHPDLTRLTAEEIKAQVLPDFANLQALGYTNVQGLAYPGGTFDQRTADILRNLGVAYARTVRATNAFTIPEDFLQWHPTCHFMQDNIFILADRFFDQPHTELSLFYVWGHAYEMDRVEGAWERFEKFCRNMSEKKDVWYAENLEICGYVNALNALKIEDDQISNNSGIPLYLLVDGKETVV